MVAKKAPAVGKDVSFPFQTAITCWIDLLGYGRMMSDAGFNPLAPEADVAIRRLRRFHRLVSEHSRRVFPTLVMNDGAVGYRDLSYRARWPTYEFLQDAWKLFQAVNTAEAAGGSPGARMVIATGFRMRGRRNGLDAVSTSFRTIIEKVRDGRLTLEQALGSASRIRSTFDIVPQLQANFAFTKAYCAEEAGSGGGLAGPRCFVDLSVFERPLPDWLDIGDPVEWRDTNLDLEATFAPLLSLPLAKEVEKTPSGTVEGGPAGVRDGLQVAGVLAKDDDVLTALRKALGAEASARRSGK